MKARGAIWRSRHPWLANVLAAAIAVCLAGFGTYGVLRDDLPIPASTRYPHRYFHFHGAEAWLMAAGFVCSAASIAIVIWGRVTATPGSKPDQGVAIIIALAGWCIILGMTVLKAIGLL